MQLMVIGLILRHLLTGAGAVVVEKGLSSSDDVQALIGALSTVAGIAWSIWQKYRTQKTD